MNWNSKTNPFGNYDNPEPLPELWKDKPHWIRLLLWYFYRNPLHNLQWYILGIVDTIDEWDITGDYPKDVWNPNDGWNRLTFTHKTTGKHKHFRSYRGKYIEFYFGIRYNGAYGVAFRRTKS